MAEQFYVLFFDTSDGVIVLPGGVKVGVQRWLQGSRGGPVRCELYATGDTEGLGQFSSYLGYRVLVLDCVNRPVWWGTVEGISTPSGDRLFSLSLAGMVNRVAVIYTENNERFTTDWEEDSESVLLYGPRERLVSLAVGREAQALAERTTQLNLLKQPASDAQMEGGGGRAGLMCVGHWQRLGKVYYASSQGYERHLTGSGKEKIGQSGYTSTGIRFEDNKIYVGSAYHFVDTDAIQKLGQAAYSAGTIGFEDGVDRIYDTANGFGAFVAGDEITVSGTAFNDGTYEVDSATASEIISTTDLDTEAEGTATITPDSYTQLGFSFSTAGGALRQVRVRAFRAGTVADNLTCTIYLDSSGDPGGGALQAVSLTGSTIPTEKGWVEFEFPGSLTLTASTTYWALFSRSGGTSASGAYGFEVDEGTGYAGGVMKVLNGTWVARPRGAADMLFEVVYAPATNIEAFVSDDVITVSGSASNDDTYTIASIETENYPWYIQVDVALTLEAAGASVTLATRYTKIAQRFLISDATGWILNLAKVKAQKVGGSAPTDGLTLQIHADSAGSIGSSLATATIDAADILATALAYVTADFGTTLSLTAGTYYWLSVKRTGADSSQTGYVIQVDDDGGYTNGKLQGWDGSAWGYRTPTSDLVFELVGVRETTQLLYDILTTTGLFAGVDVRVSSGVYASPYYDGDSLAQGAVERLLKGGTSGGNLLLATVTPERWVRIEAAPSVSNAYGMKADGRWVDSMDRDVPPHMVPAGVWLTQLDLPSTLDVAALATVIQQFIEEIEYDAGRNLARARFRQNRNPFNVGLVVG